MTARTSGPLPRSPRKRRPAGTAAVSWVFFLLSRLEKVPFPLVTREGGQTWYTWGAQETYSYRWFLYDRHLTACAVLLWLLALAGLLVLLPERLQTWRKRLPQRKK